MLWGRDSKGEKKFGLWDNCYQMLSLSVIQRRGEGERDCWRRDEKRHSVISGWHSHLLHGHSIFSNSLIFLSHVYSAYFRYTKILKKLCLHRRNSNFATKTTRIFLFFWPQHCIACNSTVSNGWVHLFPLFTFCYSFSWYTPEMKRFNVRPMWQWGGVPWSHWIERQLWQAWCCSRSCKRICACM